MHSPEQTYEELEDDRASREREIRLIENTIAKSSNEQEQNMLRRSLVLLAYAHLEGFVKFSLAAYAGAVNSLQLQCKDASTPLVALTLSRAFSALRDANSKHPEFSRLSEDKELHLLARERSFIENFERIISTQVEIPDHVVDTKSNLSSLVLKRNLYQLGLKYPIVAKHGSTIDRLLGMRNAIAHGDKLKTPKPHDISEYLSASFAVMKFVQDEIFAALRDKAYQRDASLPLTLPLPPTGLVTKAIEFIKSVRI
ncbi:MAE_28990/MAE_18760 family HEPN-like nuclease [Bradyrhizobium sp. 2TAF24]|uniref:MAE_28990/MAE_18760 family HEPN-like nuclease n=1 Tax=Bradyrhizobium sp. 2TAF24 TaxID=3233011 RepID=UPI003F90DA08